MKTVLPALALLLAAAAPADQAPVVRTDSGALRGASADGIASFKGIPYAAAPVGALRWRAPAAPEAWSGIRSAKKFGNACLQTGRMFGPGANNTYDATIGTTLGQPLGSEDCLFVNIWRPATDEKNLPVLLFIQYFGLHGRPAVRRREAGQDRQCGGHHRQLSPGHPGFPEHAAVASGRHGG